MQPKWGYNALLGTVAYEPCVLVARKEQVYTADGKFMFSVSMTERGLNNYLIMMDGRKEKKVGLITGSVQKKNV